jgi:polysaccharide biosynthesis protein PslH
MSQKIKRNILMITPYIPRLSQSGGQRSSFYSIKYLAPNNNITLICFSRDQEGLDEVKPYCNKVIVVKRGKTWDLKKILFTGFSLFPFLVVNYISDELRNAIQAELQTGKFDLVHCDCFYPMPNIPQTDIPIVLVDLTIEYAVYQHYVDSLKGWHKLLTPLLMIDVLKLKYWETHYWKTTHTVVAFGNEDQKLMAKVTDRKDIRVFQNGVEEKYFDSKPKVAKSSHPSILFGVSNMKWMQNRESVDQILNNYWKDIKKQIPDCRLYIIGRYAPKFYGHLNSQDIIVKEAENEGMKHDPQYYYNLCWLLLAPMDSGGGTRNKFFESMAFGTPVITTPLGIGGIEINNYKDTIVCQPNEIVDNTVKLLKDKNLRDKMGKAANLWVSQKYSYKKTVDELNQVYEEITHK